MPYCAAVQAIKRLNSIKNFRSDPVRVPLEIFKSELLINGLLLTEIRAERAVIPAVMRTAVAETNFLKGGKVGNCSGSNKADEGWDSDDSFCAEDLDRQIRVSADSRVTDCSTSYMIGWRIDYSLWNWKRPLLLCSGENRWLHIEARVGLTWHIHNTVRGEAFDTKRGAKMCGPPGLLNGLTGN